jgi:hypothetical protein
VKNQLISQSRVVARPRSVTSSPHGPDAFLALWRSVRPGCHATALPGHSFVESGRARTRERVVLFPATPINAQVMGAYKRLEKGPHPWRRS